jgi:hypothetical protein
MLVLTRKLNESIMIGEDIEVMVLDVREGFVKFRCIAKRCLPRFGPRTCGHSSPLLSRWPVQPRP